MCAGAPLTGDAWVARLRTPLEQAVAEERAGYERGLAAGPKYPVCSVRHQFCFSSPLSTRDGCHNFSRQVHCCMAGACEGSVQCWPPGVRLSHEEGSRLRFGMSAGAQPGTEPDLGMRIQLVHGDEVRLQLGTRYVQASIMS